MYWYWWTLIVILVLASVAGLALLLPQDSPVLNTKEDDQKKGGN